MPLPSGSWHSPVSTYRTLPPHHCHPAGRVQSEALCSVNSCSTGLASSLQANLRARPCLYATDVSPNAACGCEALSLSLSLRHGCSKSKAFVRLEWHEPEPPSEMCDSRGAAAPLAVELNWVAIFSAHCLMSEVPLSCSKRLQPTNSAALTCLPGPH